MKINKLMSNKFVTAGLVAALSLGILSTSVSAAELDDSKVVTNDVSITIESGGLHLTSPGIVDFDNATLDGEIKTYTTPLKGKIKVQDLRGTYAGWDLSAQASQFDNGTDKLPLGSLKIHTPTVDNLNSTSGPGDKKVDEPGTLLGTSTVIDGSNAVSVVKASKDEGAGTYEIDLGAEALELTVDPATAKAGNYKSTVTWTLSNTPNIE